MAAIFMGVTTLFLFLIICLLANIGTALKHILSNIETFMLLKGQKPSGWTAGKLPSDKEDE